MVDLSGFYGTEAYHRIAPNAVMTDGTAYLAKEAACYWLFQDTALFLPKYQRDSGDYMAVITLELDPVKDGSAFRVVARDGEGKSYPLFDGEFTTFPEDMMPFEFFAVYQDGAGWVLMLPSEY